MFVALTNPSHVDKPKVWQSRLCAEKRIFVDVGHCTIACNAADARSLAAELNRMADEAEAQDRPVAVAA